jgi:SAM-dependent methyltransferase
VDAEIREFFTEQYDRNWYLAARAAVLTTIIRPLCRARSACRLVDVGAGTGSILAQVGGDAGGIGIEGDWQLARYGHARHRVRFLVADVAGAIPLSAATADVTLSLDVLEHLDDDRAALREMFRILRPGGTLVVTVPAFQSLWSRHDQLHHHKRRYSKLELLEVLAATGFACTRITYFNTLLFPLVYVSRKLESLGSGDRGRKTDYEKAPRALATLLGWIFALEARVIPRWDLPVGVSLLAIATRP